LYGRAVQLLAAMILQRVAHGFQLVQVEGAPDGSSTRASPTKQRMSISNHFVEVSSRRARACMHVHTCVYGFVCVYAPVYVPEPLLAPLYMCVCVQVIW
jgi:hypothetical protein